MSLVHSQLQSAAVFRSAVQHLPATCQYPCRPPLSEGLPPDRKSLGQFNARPGCLYVGHRTQSPNVLRYHQQDYLLSRRVAVRFSHLDVSARCLIAFPQRKIKKWWSRNWVPPRKFDTALCVAANLGLGVRQTVPVDSPGWRNRRP